MYVCMHNLFKVGKIYKDSELYLQDIQSLIKTEMFAGTSTTTILDSWYKFHTIGVT